jgi:hypothetical protein
MSIRELPVGPHGDRRPSTVGRVNGDPMEGGTDVFATLVWGLRRYVLMIIAMVVALGVLVPVALAQRTAQYQATAQVGPSAKLELPNMDPLPRIAESVFTNGAVEETIRKMLGQPKGNIIPSKVQLIAAQDNIVLEVVAHASNPQQAMDIANQAAATFVLELNRYQNSVASFSLTHKAILAKKVPRLAGGYASVALGLLAGLLGGIGLVGLLLVIRRPVVDVSAAQLVTGSPVIGRISLPRHGPVQVTQDRAIGLLGRRLVHAAATIHVAAPSQSQADQFAGLLTEVFGRMPVIARPPKKNGGQPNSSASPLPKVLAPRGLDEWFCARDERSYTVLLAPEGISARKLRLFAEGHDTGAPTGVVMVSTSRGGQKSSSARGPLERTRRRRLRFPTKD